MLRATGVDGPCQQHSGPVVICISASVQFTIQSHLESQQKRFCDFSLQLWGLCHFQCLPGFPQKANIQLSWGGDKAHRSLILSKLCWRLVFCLPQFLCPSVSPALASITFDALRSVLFGTLLEIYFQYSCKHQFLKGFLFILSSPCEQSHYIVLELPSL